MKKRKASVSIKSILLFAAILGAAAALRFAGLDKSMWVDESTSYVIAGQKTARAVIGLASQSYTAHPPLYYLLAHFWFGIFGKSLLALRILSAVFGLMWVAMMYPVATAIFKKRATGYVAMAIAAFSPFAIYISQIGRMYSLLTVLTLAALWAFVKLTDEETAGRWRLPLWAALAASMAGLLYTQYYGANIIALLTVMAYFRRREQGGAFIWKWVLLLVVVAVAWSPWMRIFAAQSKAAAQLMNAIFPGSQQNIMFVVALIGTGMVFSGVPLVTLTMEQFTALFVFSCFIVLLSILWSILLLRNNKNTVSTVFLYLVVPTFLMFVSSAIVKGIVFQWHFSYISPAPMLLAAFCLTFGRSRLAKVPVVLIMLIVSVIGLQAYYRAGFWNDDWRSVSRHIIKYSEKKDIVISMIPLNDFPMKDYYLRGTGIKVESMFSAAERKNIGSSPAMVLSAMAYDHECFWLVGYGKSLAVDPDPMWLDAHFIRKREKTFPTVFTQESSIKALRLCVRDEDKQLRIIKRMHFMEYVSTAWKKQGSLDARFARADYLFSRGYVAFAEKEMRDTLAANPGMPEAMMNLAYIVRERGRDAEALALLFQAQKTKPKDKRVRFLIGETFYKMRRDKEASQYLGPLKNDHDYGPQAAVMLEEMRLPSPD